jgi:hypothetical protein
MGYGSPPRGAANRGDHVRQSAFFGAPEPARVSWGIRLGRRFRGAFGLHNHGRGAAAGGSAAAAKRTLGAAESMYAARVDEGYQLPAIPISKLDPKFVRQIVTDPTGENRAPSSSIRRSISSIWCAMAARRSVTASA